MKKQLQPKHKVMIGVGAGLLGAAAVATPLSIVLSENNISAEGNFDIQYGLDKAAYNKMKEQFTRNYASKLEAEHIEGPEAAAAMARLNKTFGSFDKQVSKLTKSKTSNTYFAATSAMLQIARHDFGVDLERKSRANWNEVQDMYDGMVDSFATYMDNNHFEESKVTEVLTNAKSRYDAMMQSLKEEYANDVLGGVLKAKTQMLSFFDSVNNEIAKIAGMIRLNEFMKNYTMQFRNDATSLSGVTDVNENRVDILKANGELTVGSVIGDLTMNKVFVCYNNETRQEVPFESTMIPGYKLTPTLKGFVDNGITNDHSIRIDWSIVSDNAEDAEKATAHLLEVDDEVIAKAKKEDAKTYDDIFNITDSKIKLTDYNVFSSKTNESTLLADTYFNKAANGTNIEFTWDKSLGAEPCYDGFMYADQTVTTVQKLTLRQLAQTGVAIKCGSDVRLLKDVIALVDQDNYEPKNMIENFVRYCDIEDEITINGKVVNNTFNAFYKNETNWKQNGQEGLATVNCANMVADSFEISEQFYENINNSYNLAYKHTHVFLDDTYKDVADDAEAVNVINKICLGIEVGVFGYLSLKLTMYTLALQVGKSLAAMVLVGLQCGILKLTADADSRFENRYVKPVKAYARKADQFNDSGATDDVKGILQRDAHLFVLYDEKNPLDPAVFQEKMQYFRDNIDPVEQQKLFRLYEFFEVDPNGGKYFFQNAFDLGIDPDHFLSDIGCWKKHSIEFGICFSLMMLSFALIFFIQALDAPSAGADAAGQTPAVETAGEAISEAFRVLG